MTKATKPSRIIFLTALFLFGACHSGNREKKTQGDRSKGPVGVNAMVARLQGFSNTIEANGSLIAAEYVQLRPEMNGRVVYVNIPEGRPIIAGTLLLKLYDEDLKAQLKKTESQLEIARKTELRLKSLLDVNGLNQQDYDLALNQVQNLEADLDLVRSQISKTEIRAPFSGIIGLRHVSLGAFVTPQDIVATLQQVNQMKVDFVLPEAYAGLIQSGGEVTIVSEDGQTHIAKIIGAEPLVNANTRNVQIRALIINTEPTLRPGAFVKVRIDASEKKQSILVPANCIIPDTRFKKIAVIRHGKIEMVNVETGFRGESNVEIISGMTPGDTFAVSGLLFLKPGSEVVIKSIKP